MIARAKLIALASAWHLAGCAAAVAPAGARSEEGAPEASSASGPAAPEGASEPDEAARLAEEARARWCAAAGEDRAAFEARRGEGDEPHALLRIPFALLDELVAPEVAELEPTPIRSVGTGSLGPALDGLAARVRRVTFEPAPPGRVGLAVLVGIEREGRLLFDLVADLTVEPELDREASRLVVAVRPEDLSSVTPRPAPDAAGRLGEELRRLLPPLLRGAIGAAVLRRVAAAALDEVLARGWPEARARLAGEASRLPRLDLDLGGLPIESLDVTSESAAGGRLIVAVTTELPVRRAAPAPAPADAPRAGGAEVFIPGATAVELANWAVATGRAPGRVDARGRPSDDGPFELGLSWDEGPRPLRAHLWSDEPCALALVSSRPETRLEGDEVELRAAEVTVESFEGPLSLRLAAISSRLWGSALDLGRAPATRPRLAAAGRDVTLRIASIEPAAGGFLARVELSPAP